MAKRRDKGEDRDRRDGAGTRGRDGFSWQQAARTFFNVLAGVCFLLLFVVVGAPFLLHVIHPREGLLQGAKGVNVLAMWVSVVPMVTGAGLACALIAGLLSRRSRDRAGALAVLGVAGVIVALSIFDIL